MLENGSKYTSIHGYVCDGMYTNVVWHTAGHVRDIWVPKSSVWQELIPKWYISYYVVPGNEPLKQWG